MNSYMIRVNEMNFAWELIHAETEAEALESFAEDLQKESKTYYVHVSVVREDADGSLPDDPDSDDCDEYRNEYLHFAVDPDEPECIDNKKHRWHSPHSLFGGCEANPGVFGNAGGVIIKEICKRCKTLRTTDTWAQHGAVQGLTSIEYGEYYE